MNLVLLEPRDFITTNTIALSGERFKHLTAIKKVSKGSQFIAGKINDNIGSAIIDSIDSTHIYATVTLNKSPPKPLPLTVVIALPRPKMLKRILHICAEMGVKEIVFINSYKVEKSYWSSPALDSATIKKQLKLGLSQAIDTQIPRVTFYKTFKPFIEDVFPALACDRLKILGLPESPIPAPVGIDESSILILGPEGGFTDYENQRLIEAGCNGVTLGQRIYRLETALPVILGRLFN